MVRRVQPGGRETRHRRHVCVALRTVLRQDPDIIMVGEIRDTETAGSPCRRRSRVIWCCPRCTNDALLDYASAGFEGPRLLITSTVIGILAQRLVRVICSHCSRNTLRPSKKAAALGAPLGELKLKRRGCLHCRQTGYIGRDGFRDSADDRCHPAPGDRAGGLHEGIRRRARRRNADARETAIEKVFQG